MIARLIVAVALLAGLVVSSPAAAGHHRSECERVVRRAACTHVQVFGHRGREWSTNTNENTLLAFQLAARVGASFEADAWVLADGTAVVFHDKTLARVVDPASLPTGVTSKTRITALTTPQFRQLRTRGGQPLITVKRLIRFSGRHRVPGVIENKYAMLDGAQIAAWLRKFHAPVALYETPKCEDGQVVRPAVADFGIRVGAKYVGGCHPTAQQLADAGFAFMLTATKSLTHTLVQEAHQAGLRIGNLDSGHVQVWTRLVAAGADYLLVPHPARAEKWLR